MTQPEMTPPHGFHRALTGTDPDSDRPDTALIELTSDRSSVRIQLASQELFTVAVHADDLDVLIDSLRGGQRCAVVAWHDDHGRVLFNAHPHQTPDQPDLVGLPHDTPTHSIPRELELALGEHHHVRIVFPPDQAEKLLRHLTEARALLTP
jgi:hypothetical protein